LGLIVNSFFKNRKRIYKKGKLLVLIVHKVYSCFAIIAHSDPHPVGRKTIWKNMVVISSLTWAYTQKNNHIGIPAECDPLEGWIAEAAMEQTESLFPFFRDSANE
jgi:hypothetical protein